MGEFLAIVAALPRARQAELARTLGISASNRGLVRRLAAAKPLAIVSLLSDPELRAASKTLGIDSSGQERTTLIAGILEVVADAPPAVDHLAAYVRLTKAMSTDELHDQIARKGLAILEQGIPYVIQAARWRRIDAARRAAHEVPLPDREPSDQGQIASPFAAVAASEERRNLIEALSTLGDVDVLAVWRHHEGWPDERIADAIEAVGGGRLTMAAIRKRRERAMEKLRDSLTGRNHGK